MARKLRIDYKGALYHVMCRGNNEEYILKEEDKQIYLNLIKKYKARYGFKIYAYCIMDNHVHIIGQVGTVLACSRFYQASKNRPHLLLQEPSPFVFVECCKTMMLLREFGRNINLKKKKHVIY